MKLVCRILTFLSLCLCSAACYGVDTEVVGGTTFIKLDAEQLAALQLVTPDEPLVVSDGVDTTTMDGYLGFPISDRDAGTTAAYDTDDFPASYSGVFAHTGSIAFPAVDAEIGNFAIGFDAARATDELSGFFAATTLDNALQGVPLFDIPTQDLMVSALSDRFDVDADLLISPELATVLDAAQVAGLQIGQVKKRALAVPEPGTGLLGFLATMALLAYARRNA